MPRASASSEEHGGDALDVLGGEGLEVFIRRVSVRWSERITLFMFVCVLLWWPLEFLLHGGSQAGESAFSLLRMVLAPTLLVLLLVYRFTPVPARFTYLFACLTTAPQLVLVGYCSGLAGGLDSPWMFLSCGATGLSLVLVVPLLQRTAVALGVGASMIAGFLVQQPEALGHRLFPLLVSHMIFTALVFTLVGHVVYRLIQRSYGQQQRLFELNHDLEGRVREATAQLRHLTQKLQHAVDDERSELAREIHDHLGQELTALQLAVALLRRRSEGVEGLALAFGEVDALIQRTRETMQRLVRRLEPRMLAQLGLVAALRLAAEDLARRADLEVHVSIDDEEALTASPPPKAVSKALYSVAIEALSNVARHAQASGLWLRLEDDGERLTLSVEDDGVGFAAAPEVGEDAPGDLRGDFGGLGLVGIRERLGGVGGEARFEASERGGAKVWVRVARALREDGA